MMNNSIAQYLVWVQTLDTKYWRTNFNLHHQQLSNVYVDRAENL